MKPLKGTSVLSTTNSRQGGGGVIGYAVSGFDFIYGIIIALMNIVTGFFTTLFPRSGGPAPHELSQQQQQQQQPFFRNLRGGQRLGGGDGVGSGSAANESSSSATTARDNKETSAQK